MATKDVDTKASWVTLPTCCGMLGSRAVRTPRARRAGRRSLPCDTAASCGSSTSISGDSPATASDTGAAEASGSTSTRLVPRASRGTSTAQHAAFCPSRAATLPNRNTPTSGTMGTVSTSLGPEGRVKGAAAWCDSSTYTGSRWKSRQCDMTPVSEDSDSTSGGADLDRRGSSSALQHHAQVDGDAEGRDHEVLSRHGQLLRHGGCSSEGAAPGPENLVYSQGTVTENTEGCAVAALWATLEAMMALRK
ncbi:NADPH-dependent 7-cyano-7-deazaguanine reductase [Frankliniella fusca]|uniref:NADPH-dependent 7-cyano-7-deazaguanine reductase n=1 Tax=Frankliniella fusca TaxID=407009 RepID=A0AAE1LIG7_9NEOP|nr:NADPH-dependent 7-cyano-7-deazaguanine reductase [Frankliniella fusca]